RVFAQEIPSLFAIEHGVYDIASDLIAPLCFPRGPEVVLLADAQGDEAGGRAGFEGDQAGLALRPAQDARSGGCGRIARESEVAELLVLIAELAAFDAAMERGAFDARAKVAPVVGRQRACAR